MQCVHVRDVDGARQESVVTDGSGSHLSLSAACVKRFRIRQEAISGGMAPSFCQPHQMFKHKGQASPHPPQVSEIELPSEGRRSLMEI